MDLQEPLLGDGSFSICRRCIHKATQQEFAVKIVSRRVDCTREINLLRVCQGHPNVVRFYEVFYDEVIIQYPRKNETFSIIVSII